MARHKILIIGSGGREHALAWRCTREGHDVWAAPGSDGMGRDSVTCIEASPDDHAGLVELCLHQKFDVVVVGPEKPLVEGLADRMRDAGVPVFGPSAGAAALEGSKALAKAFMERHQIPTARHVTVRTAAQAEAALGRFSAPPVVKASGLAAGKGVVVSEDFDQARAAIRDCLDKDRFGAAGRELVLEERLEGEEASFFVLTDGMRHVTLDPCQDHKRIHDGDRGPNTGGMGAYAPAPVFTEDVRSRVMASIVEPTLQGLRQEGNRFCGVLFVGLMIGPDGMPNVIEYNVRFGDPEAQPLMLGLVDPIADHFVAAARGELQSGTCRGQPAVSVVMASAGYPASSTKGVEIHGLETLSRPNGPDGPGVLDVPDVKIFHAGTRRRDGRWETAGGRVLGVCATGRDLGLALQRAYDAVDGIRFDGAQVRRDIGARAVGRGRAT